MESTSRQAPATPNLLPGEVEANAIGIPEDVARNQCERLNQDMCNLYVAYHQFKKHHWLVEGPDFRDLHLLLDEVAALAIDHADELAERITNLGGVPAGSPAAQERAATVEPEPEGRFTVRAMFQNDLALMERVVQHLRDDVVASQESNDPGSSHLLQKLVYKQEDSAQRLAHVLAGDTSLERGLP